MKTTIVKNEFKDIKTVVFYKFNKYIPELSYIDQDLYNNIKNNFKSIKIQYKGSEDKLDDNTFSEYNLSYCIDKKKFNDELLIEYLDDISLNKIGKNTKDLITIENSIFPTLSNEVGDINNKFFKSGLVSNQLVLTFNINEKFEENIWKIEFYEDIIDSNNIEEDFICYEFLNRFNKNAINKIPIAIITFGPENTTKNNPDEFYFEYDPMLSDKNNNERLTLKEYKELLEEIYNYKYVITSFLNKDGLIELNLSYKSWINSINPNRNMNKYLVRNDDFYSLINSYDSLKNIEDYLWIDKTSGNIVGNSIIEYLKDNFPILYRKISKYYNNNKYSSSIEYNLGDKVTYNESIWESLSNENINNNPYFDNNWILSSKVNSIFTTKVLLEFNPFNSGYFENNNEVNKNYVIISNNESFSFYLKNNTGYTLNTKNPCSISNSEYLPDTDYELINISKDLYIIKIKRWENVFKTNKIIFNYLTSKSFLEFNALGKDSLYIQYFNWINYFSEPNLKFSEILVNNTPIDITKFNGSIELNIADNIKIKVSELNNYKLNNISANYLIDNETVNEIIPVLENEDRTYSFEDTVKFTRSTYTLNLIKKFYKIKILNLEGFEVSEVISQINYDSEYNLKFYTKNESRFKELTLINPITEKFITINEFNLNSLIDFENIKIKLSKKDDIYNFYISNVKTNYNIQLIKYDNQ